jgi:hypothetical protein
MRPSRNITLREFKLTDVRDDTSCLFIGNRNTGKTTNIYNLLQSKENQIDTAMIISPTSVVNGNYTDIVPKKFIHYTYSPQLVDALLKRQQRLIKKAEDEKSRGGKEQAVTSVLILDDMAFDKDWQKDKNISFIAMNGRHYKCLFIVSLQYCLTMKPGLRSNFQWIFLSRCCNRKEKQKLYEYFAGMFNSFYEFEQIFDDVTKNYGCMVINMNSPSNNIEDYVFYWRANPINKLNFTICSRRYWECSNTTDEVSNHGTKTYELNSKTR